MMKVLDNNYQNFFFFAFLFKFVKPIRHFYSSHNAPYFPPKKILCKHCLQYFSASFHFSREFCQCSASVNYNRVLSHFQFAERFYVNPS